MKNSLYLVLLFLSCATTIVPPSFYVIKTYGNITVDSIIRVNRGSRFIANLKDCPDIMGEKINVYIYGIHSPSPKDTIRKTAEIAIKAKEFTTKALKKAKTIELRNMQRHRNFIIIAEVYVDGENLAKKLLRAKLATQYYGEPITEWE